VRTDLIDLDIARRRVRVLSEVPEATEALNAALIHHLVPEPGEPSFVLKEPDRPGGLCVLLDRAGFVLARSRTFEDIVAVLLRHLGVFLAPPPGTTRLSMRTLLADDGTATLVGFPLFSTPPVVERRLQRVGQRIVDRLVVDVRSDGKLALTASPWRSSLAESDVVGHADVSELTGLQPARLFLPQVTNQPLSEAATLASVAAALSSGASHADVMETARSIILQSMVQAMPWNQHLARYEMLR
jgi:hypothetical protein